MKNHLKKFSILILSLLLIFTIINPIRANALAFSGLYRYYNGTDHFYTTDTYEGTVAKGYKFENVVGLVYDKQYYSDLSPVYRYYNGKDHYYTTNFNELGNGKNGYKLEQNKFYVTKTSNSKLGFTIPVYSYYNGTDHFYTSNWNELKGGSGSYKYLGVAFYVKAV